MPKISAGAPLAALAAAFFAGYLPLWVALAIAATALLLSSFGSTCGLAAVSSENLASRKGKSDDDIPDLFDEVDQMWKAAAQAYLLTAAQKQCRNDFAKDNPCGTSEAERAITTEGPVGRRRPRPRRSSSIEKLTDAVSTKRLLEQFDENMDSLKDMLEGDETYALALDSLKQITKTAGDSGDYNNITLQEFDMIGEENRCVYMIAKNCIQKRITVIFRGSVEDTQDWTRNFQFDNADMTVPKSIRDSLKAKPRIMKMHRGYYEYLFNNEERDEHHRLERFDEVIENVRKLFKENPGYKLYVTGHSLGAGISTMFATRAAASTALGIPKPVNLVTFASPYVGDQTFREVFQALERKGWIRHLRVSNERDFVVCLFPFTSSGDNMYRHVGVNLRLFRDENKVELLYPKVGGNFISRLLSEINRGWKNSILKNWQGDEERSFHHGCAEYTKRIRSHEKAVRRDVPRKLNDIYRGEEFVGELHSKL